MLAPVVLTGACSANGTDFPLSPPQRPPEIVLDSESDGPPCPSANATGTEPAGGERSETGGLRIAHSLDVPEVSSTNPSGIERDADLERLISDRIGEDSSHYSVVIKDLRTGRGASLAAEQEYYAASLFKLDVMYEIFRQRDAGLVDFDERYTVSEYYWGFDLGPRLLQLCGTVTVKEALGAMLSVSDNIAAVMLQDRAGSENINRTLEQLGLERTRLLPDGLPTTAADVAQLLESIARADGVSRKGRSEMLALMTSESVDDRLAGQLPSETVISHKTGSWSTATHDAGIVFGKKSTYIMVVMSDLGLDSAAAEMEADIARIAWDYFEQ